MGLFPSYIENDKTLTTARETKPPPKEYEIDFKTGQLTGRIVTGLAAIKIWIWFTLQTARYRYYAYTWDYGNEFEDLIGQGYTEEYIEAEVQRMAEDCLLVNEHIQSITDFAISMKSGKLKISFTANSIYGEIRMSNINVANAA